MVLQNPVKGFWKVWAEEDRPWAEGLAGFNVWELDTLPRPSIYPLLDPKCPLFGTIYPYLRVQGGSW